MNSNSPLIGRIRKLTIQITQSILKNIKNITLILWHEGVATKILSGEIKLARYQVFVAV